MVNVDVTVASKLNQNPSGSPRLSSGGLVASALLILGMVASCVANAQVNVTTAHNDIGRTGQNLNETILTTSNVNPNQFGKLFSHPVDGQVYAQPLYLQGITINGTSHNVVFVATENDSVYAFDADTNGGGNSNPLWYAPLLSPAYGAAPGATAINYTTVASNDIAPILGITGTPVIDQTTGTLYVVSDDFENGSSVERLHALSVSTGAEKFGGPVVITATVAGKGSGSVNGSLTFDPQWENQRPGLLLLNGIVYVGFAAQGDNGPWHGWIFGYNASTLQQTGVYCSSPNGVGSGFWMSGAGLAADQLDLVNHPYGRLFVPTGNGDYNAVKPYTGSMDYGETDLALDLTNGIPTVIDEFTTYQQANLTSADLDQGSGGLMVLPTQTTGNYPHLAIQTGKTGNIYLLNRDNLGGYNSTDQVVQILPLAVGSIGAWSSPAYWNGNVYYWGRIDYLKSFSLVNGLLSTNPSESEEQIGFPGATPSISANGNTQGIVWTIDSEYNGSGPAILAAHDASDVDDLLYSSATNSARDNAGIAVKFAVPTIANGKVYVGAQNEVDIYGLLSGNTQTPAPIFTPGSQSFTGTTFSVSITDANPNASIYYTTNGTPATTTSTLYTGQIPVTVTETINAIATASGQNLSAQSSATYTSTTETQAVVFSQPGGTYGAVQLISLTDPTPNAVIYYTTDGSTPITSGTTQTYSGPITVGTSETITATAVAPGFTAGPVTAATYTIQEGITGISFPEGFASSTGLIILNGVADLDDTRLQMTDGGLNEASSAWFHTPVDIQTFTTSFSYQLSNPAGNGITFAIQNSPATVNALGGSGQNLGYAPIANSLAIKFDLVNNATGLYLNGTVPMTPATSLSGTPINLYSDDAMVVTLVYNGTYLAMTIHDLVTTQSWSTGWTINIPATIGSTSAYVGFTGSSGAQSSSQKILSWTYVNNYSKPVGLLERATAGTTGGTPADDLYISGWIADPTDGSPMNNVTVYLDGVSIGKPTLGVVRADVTTSQKNAAYGKSGFTLVYPTNLSAGAHSVTVIGIDSHGVSTTLGPVAVTVTTGSFGSLDKAVDSANGSTAVDSWDKLVVTGWIADPVDGSPMSNVHVLIDGAVVGAPNMGIARPDIVVTYGNPAFLNSGYMFTYPGSSLTRGSHVVTVVGVNSRGISTTLGPLNITAGPPIGNLESVVDASTHGTTILPSDQLFVGGWVADPVDGSPVASVKVLLDGVSIGTPTVGLSRPDVVKSQNNGSYLHSGFSFYYPASSLKGGSHAVTVVGTNSRGVSATFGPRNIVVERPFGGIDQAIDNSTKKTTVATYDSFYVGGWLVDPVDGSPVNNVKVLIDGIVVGAPTVGLSRPDVATYFNNPAYTNAGFAFTYAASLLSVGTHAVTIVAVDSHGASATIGPTSFTVAIVAKGPTGSLDQAVDPTTGSTTIPTADNLYVSGWIADPTDGSPMSNVKVLIDGVAVGTPILNIPRPDVAAADANPRYTNSGYHFTYAASHLAVGAHVVTVVGIDSLGLSATLGPKTINVVSH